ncbi:hypothetical protein [Longispora urticae]
MSASRDDLGGLATVWYVDDKGRHADWNTPSARPLLVRDAVRHRAGWPESRTLGVSHFMRGYARGTEPALLLLPAITVPRVGPLLLDSTHRSCAAYAANVDVRLMIVSLEGPLDSRHLPDLSHYRSDGSD